MNNQVHKRLSNEQVKAILGKYCQSEIRAGQAQTLLDIKRSQFFEWAKRYRQNPATFTVEYKRKKAPRIISEKTEQAILRELKQDHSLIQNKKVPVWKYNYRYIQKQLEEKQGVIVSAPTIIDRAKKHGFYIPRKKGKQKHDREVITNYVGELIQHDSSHHLFAPYTGKKWYLVTSIDDYSRFMLYGNLFERETSWRHIEALEYVICRRGIPFKYYVDQHSIFRYVERRDSLYYKHILKEDDADPQWKKVLRDLKIGVTYALSAPAKGKVERPYGWLQDHLVRTCAREGIKKINEGREVLKKEINQYNYKQVHSTTQEVPIMRLEKAVKENRSLFSPFKIPFPYECSKDIFCLRISRTTDGYRKISLDGIRLRVPVDPYEKVELRLVPYEKNGLTEVRIWHKMKLVDVQTIRTSDLKLDPF